MVSMKINRETAHFRRTIGPTSKKKKKGSNQNIEQEKRFGSVRMILSYGVCWFIGIQSHVMLSVSRWECYRIEWRYSRIVFFFFFSENLLFSEELPSSTIVTIRIYVQIECKYDLFMRSNRWIEWKISHFTLKLVTQITRA